MGIAPRMVEPTRLGNRDRRLRMLGTRSGAPRLRRILVPTDFSASSLRALEYAVRLSRFQRAEIVLLFVEGLFTYGVSGDFLTSAAAARYFEEQGRMAKTALLRLKKSLERRGVECRAVFVTGIPAESIVATAKRMDADLIVMATHGRRGVPRFFLGSVAEKVVRLAERPVLTLRPRSGSTRQSRRRPSGTKPPRSCT